MKNDTLLESIQPLSMSGFLAIDREKSPGKNDLLLLNNFDLIRLMAAIEVVTRHTLVHLGVGATLIFKLLSYFPGVSILFVVSGYLISSSLEKGFDLRRYFKARWRRIFPAMWVLLALTVIIFSALGADFLRSDGLVWLIAQCVGLVYTPGFLAGFGIGSYNGALWTIPVNIQFYVSLPVMYYLLKKSSKFNQILLGLLFLFCASAVIAHQMYTDNGVFGSGGIGKIIRYSLLSQGYLFLFGVVLRRFEVYNWSSIRDKGVYWLVGYMAFHATTDYMGLDLVVLKGIILGVVVLSLAYTQVGLSRKLISGFDVSFGIFLYHGLIINCFIQLGWRGAWYHVLAIFGITLLLAALSWKYIESPMLGRSGSR